MSTATEATAKLTPTCQNQPFTSAALLSALESAWTAIRAKHPDVPAAVIIVGSGSPARGSANLKWGHFASLRWQVGNDRVPEVLVSGEGLSRTPDEVLTTLLHEAAHGLAEVRKIKDTSRQGRWHNQRFAALADELGLVAEKDELIGWSPCTLRTDTAERYAAVLDELDAAMSAYRHIDKPGRKTRASSNNGVCLACECPRKIRVAESVANEGSITCGVCESAFTAED
jgi:hypothetical protein